MPDEQAAPVTAEAPAAPAVSNDALASMMGLAPETTTPAAPAPVAEVVDPLAEELFTDERLATPEAVRAARDVLRAEIKKANDLRRKAQSAHSAAEAREHKFKRTKDETLAEKSSLRAREAMLTAHLQAMESGDPEQFMTALGKLSRSGNPQEFWREVALKIAGGGKKEAEIPQAVADRLAQLENILSQRSYQEQSAAEENQIAQLSAQMLTEAQTSEATPMVMGIASEDPNGARSALMNIKLRALKQTGRPIDTATACSILESELQAQFELFQRAHGKTTGEKGTTSLGLDAGRETSASIAKPATAQRPPPKPQTATTIPAQLSGASGGASRAQTDEERNAEIARAFPPEFWRTLGIGVPG